MDEDRLKPENLLHKIAFVEAICSIWAYGGRHKNENFDLVHDFKMCDLNIAIWKRNSRKVVNCLVKS
jgi:hypothetical protein